jgi:hypothetical protein
VPQIKATAKVYFGDILIPGFVRRKEFLAIVEHYENCRMAKERRDWKKIETFRMGHSLCHIISNNVYLL